MTVRSNDVTALDAAAARTSIEYIKGGFNFSLSGTWAGTISLLRRRPEMKRLGTQTGGDGQAVFTDANLKKRKTETAIVADELIGKIITNDTDGSMSTITDNTATTITGVLAGGTQDDWDNGEVASIWDVVATYTANTDPAEVGVEHENGVDYMAAFTTYTSGTANAVISK